MTMLLALLLCGAGFMGLCAADHRHQKTFVGQKLSANAARQARWGGWAALAISWALCWSRFGFGYGTVVWIGCLSVGAGVAVGLLTWRSRKPAPRKHNGK